MAKLSFTDHPQSVGETYFEHMGVAASFSAMMILGGLACLLHGLFPFLFTRTGSGIITILHERMVTHRRRHDVGLSALVGPVEQIAQRSS